MNNEYINIDDNARAVVKANLAIRCAVPFKKAVTPGLANLADETLSRLRASVIFIGEVQYPDTLPIGSGNECPTFGTFDDNRFFDQNKKENF